ncbi:MAG: hypothetical protein KGL16_14590 [Acidobacteriota bacterium]|nr:hypothetical protein [Acidobacteriota bacterium]
MAHGIQASESTAPGQCQQPRHRSGQRVQSREHTRLDESFHDGDDLGGGAAANMRNRGKAEAAVWNTVFAHAARASALCSGDCRVAVTAAACGTAKPELTGKIVLDHTRVAVGQGDSGELVIDNRTSNPRVMAHACRTDWYEVTLRSPRWDEGSVFVSDTCFNEENMVAKPGVSVFRFRIPARSIDCVGDVSGPGVIRCAKISSSNSTIMPLVPPGRYTTVFASGGDWAGPQIKDATLVVTRAG